MQDKKEFLARIEGWVQGVGYRYYAEKHARLLGIAGYAKNLYNGGVEVLAQGDLKVLEQFAVLLEIGPAAAEVRKIDIQWREPEKEIRGFGSY